MAGEGVTLAGAGQALDALNTTYSEFKLLRDETGVVRSTATRMDLKPQEGSSKNAINYNRVQAFNVDDGLDIAQAQQITDTVTTWSPSEVAVQCTLGGRTMRRSPDANLLKQAGRILNNAFNLKEDQDGLTQLASFTGSATIGAAGTVASPGHMLAGGTRLATGDNRDNPEPAPGPWFGLLHPYAALPLAGRLVGLTDVPTGTTVYGANTGAHGGVTVGIGGVSGDQMELIRRGIGAVGSIGGLIIKQDANFTVNSSDDFTGACYSQEGLVYVSEEEPRLDPDSSDKSMRGAVELNVWGSYTFGNYRPANYGIPWTFDASKPTS